MTSSENVYNFEDFANLIKISEHKKRVKKLFESLLEKDDEAKEASQKDLDALLHEITEKFLCEDEGRVITGDTKTKLDQNLYPEKYYVMQNRMIEAWHSMSIGEKRLFILASPRVRLNQATESDKIVITAKEFSEACGIDLRSAYSQLEDACNQLRGRYFSYVNTEEKRVSVHWIIRVVYKNGEVGLYFPQEVIFMLSLFDEKNYYTKFEISTALKLKKAYSIQLYQLLKQYEKLGKREFTVDNFIQIFQLNNKYDAISNLRVRVIQPAVKEICEVTDLNVKFFQIKKGTKIEKFLFEISPKKEKQVNPPAPTEQVNPPKTIKTSDIFKTIINNNLLEQIKIDSEATSELHMRISNDVKNGNTKFWIDKLSALGCSF